MHAATSSVGRLYHPRRVRALFLPRFPTLCSISAGVPCPMLYFCRGSLPYALFLPGFPVLCSISTGVPCPMLYFCRGSLPYALNPVVRWHGGGLLLVFFARRSLLHSHSAALSLRGGHAPTPPRKEARGGESHHTACTCVPIILAAGRGTPRRVSPPDD
eukprot:5090079-Pyramimonas_sp.AAC.2